VWLRHPLSALEGRRLAGVQDAQNLFRWCASDCAGEIFPLYVSAGNEGTLAMLPWLYVVLLVVLAVVAAFGRPALPDKPRPPQVWTTVSADD
jgi:hypothetical protein